jgi:phenylalanyl-tRNA synthetase beta chain
MLTCSQPLHAFDLDKVRGGRIDVRRAREGETMVTLDDVERRFNAEAALVCDGEGPSGIAGIMGGQISEVSEGTTRVLMEAATWVGPNIMRTSKALGLRTEASARFEKQLHPELAMAGQRLAARLMVELCGARMVPGTVDVYPRPAEPRVVPLRYARMEKLLGERIEDETARGILGRLGFERQGVRPLESANRVGVRPLESAALRSDDEAECWRVPPWRDSDVQREADLIEEVARIHGLDKLPTTLPARRNAVGRLTRSQRLRRRLEDLLRDRGLNECVSYSFTSPAAIARLRLDGVPLLRLDNPLSEDQSVMRPLLLPGLLDAARHNAAHGRAGVRLFESAHVYRPSEPLDAAPAEAPGGRLPALERHHLGVLVTEAAPGGWRSERRPADFFAARALLEAVLDVAGVDWVAEEGGRSFLHPGRAASIVARESERKLGWLGDLHPLVAREWDVPGPVAGFELDVEAVLEVTGGREDVYRDVTSFPAVLQDIAVVVPEGVPAAEVEEAVRAGGGDLLSEVVVFDLYRGEQAGEGNKSLALRLEFRAPDRTLTDEEVARRREAIERELDQIGGRLRA